MLLSSAFTAAIALSTRSAYDAAVARKLSTTAVRRLFTVVGVVGLVVLIVDVVLVVLDPTQPGPYFTAVSGLCTVFVAVIALRAVRRAPGGS
jgi:hypothetical protein